MGAGGHDAGGQADKHRDRDRRHSQLRRGDERLGHVRADGRRVAIRDPQVSAHEALDVDAVLRPQRLVEAETVTHQQDRVLGRVEAGHEPRGIARKQADEHEHRDRHTEDGGDRRRNTIR